MMTRLSGMRPYGWGCKWAETYCARYSEKYEEACLNCNTVLCDEEKDMWIEYLTMRLKHRNNEITKEEYDAFIEQKVSEFKEKDDVN